jgi:restriction system protein
MRPVLVVLSDGEERPRKQVIGATVDSMNLSEADLAETLRGGNSRARSRAHWAVEYLAQAGAVERPRRGILKINDVGRQLLKDHPDGFRVKALRHLPGMQEWERRTQESARSRRAGHALDRDVDDEPLQESPLEKLIEAVEDLDRHTATQLVQRLREQEPVFLERAVIKLLHAMGYGGSEEDGEHLGKSHDGGLDGVIRQDALGIERIYLQAKRYAAGNTVGAGAIREFVGALTGVGASGGVFITTSSFSTDAIKYVERLSPRVILIDGRELGRLMVDYGVGVTTTQTLRVTEVDENFFDGE